MNEFKTIKTELWYKVDHPSRKRIRSKLIDKLLYSLIADQLIWDNEIDHLIILGVRYHILDKIHDEYTDEWRMRIK